MRITPGEEIAGTRSVLVRNFLRAHKNGVFTPRQLCKFLRISASKANRILQALTQRHWVRKENSGFFAITDEGVQFAAAIAHHGLTAQKAEQLVQGVLQRVKEVNSSERWAYRVEKVELFGSFAERTKTLFGDVDLMISLAPASTNPLEHARRSFTHPYAKIEVLDYLKGKNLGVSLALPKTKPRLKRARYRIIYPADGNPVVDKDSALLAWLLRDCPTFKPCCFGDGRTEAVQFVLVGDAGAIDMFGGLRLPEFRALLGPCTQLNSVPLKSLKGLVRSLVSTMSLAEITDRQELMDRVRFFAGKDLGARAPAGCYSAYEPHGIEKLLASLR